MSKQFALEYLLRQSPAIDRHKRFARPQTVRMNALRHQLFPCSAFSYNHDIAVSRRYPVDHVKYALHGRTVTDYVAEMFFIFERFIDILFCQSTAPKYQRLLDNFHKSFIGKGLLQKMEGPAFD